MNILISEKIDKNISDFFARCGNSVFPHYTDEWLQLITTTFGGKNKKIIVEDGGKIIGYMPLQIMEKGNFRFANSMPVCGSYGSMLFDAKLTEEEKNLCYRKLFVFIDELCYAEKIQGFTVIGNPLIWNEKKFIDSNWEYQYFTGKFNQINDLSNPLKFNENVYRNIRKAQKSNVKIIIGYDDKLIDDFYEIYKINRNKYNASVFDINYFISINKFMASNNKADFVFATLDGKFLSGLVTLKANSIVSYHEPVNDENYKQFQANSLLINELLLKYTAEGYRYWSWGASPTKECGVFKFKNTWRPEVIEYGCYTKLYEPIEKLKKDGLSYELLIRDFRNYFVINYDLLKDK